MGAGTIEQVMRECNNYFYRNFYVLKDDITGGSLPASMLQKVKSNYYMIYNSYKNDGLHNISDVLEDEPRGGIVVYEVAPPNAFLELCNEIDAWITANAEAQQAALKSPYSSESFSDYSYSLRDDLKAQGASGGLSGWQSAFASRLNMWRKL